MATLNTICKQLLFEEPFFGMLILSLNKQETTKVETAGVGIQGTQFMLLVNPNFWDSLTDDKQKGLLIHELQHLAFFHITDYKHLTEKEIANVAMDLYINQHIDKKYLPEGGSFIENFKDLGLLPGESTNEYYKKLMQQCDNSGEVMSQILSDKGIDSPQHDWQDVDESAECIHKIAKKNFESVIKEVAEQVTKNHGNVPGDILELIKQMDVIEPPKFNWKKFVRTFIGNAVESYTRKTKRKKSNRFADAYGQREEYRSHILFAIDSSASVDNEMLKKLTGELVHIHRTGTLIDIVVCDTNIRDQYRFKRGMDLEISGRGGTSFQPVIDLYRENLKKYSCLIYVTDGECSAPVNPKGKILWVVPEERYVNEELPGKCIYLN